MDTLTRYIFSYYPHLMTAQEQAAYRSLHAEEKAQASSSPAMQRMLRTNWVSSDPEVRQLLEHGSEQFMVNVRNRILQEHSESVFLNYCPRCGALTKTPRAKQCPECFFSWHEGE